MTITKALPFFALVALAACNHTERSPVTAPEPVKDHYVSPASVDTVYNKANIYIGDNGDIMIFRGNTCLSIFNHEFKPFTQDEHSMTITLWPDDIIKLPVKRYADSSMRITLSERATDTNTTLYKKLNKVKPLPTRFTVLKLNTSQCFGTCPVMTLVIDSSGNYLYRGAEYTQYPHIRGGRLGTAFMNWLIYFMDQCKWKQYKNYYSRSVTDNPTDSLIVEFTEGTTYKVQDYASGAPPALETVIHYLFKTGVLIDHGYMKNGAVSGAHYQVSDLKVCKTMEDSVRYMQDYDPTLYQLPQYPGGLDSIDHILESSFENQWRAMGYEYGIWAMLKYVVDTTGNISLPEYVLYSGVKDLKKNPMTTVVKTMITKSFAKVGKAKPAIWNGKKVMITRNLVLLLPEKLW